MMAPIILPVSGHYRQAFRLRIGQSVDAAHEMPKMSAARKEGVMVKAVIWDFGGVLTTSPFESFNRYEEERGLPKDLIRTINATHPRRRYSPNATFWKDVVREARRCRSDL